jgi:hypothetical protein
MTREKHGAVVEEEAEEDYSLQLSGISNTQPLVRQQAAP